MFQTRKNRFLVFLANIFLTLPPCTGKLKCPAALYYGPNSDRHARSIHFKKFYFCAKRVTSQTLVALNTAHNWTVASILAWLFTIVARDPPRKQ